MGSLVLSQNQNPCENVCLAWLPDVPFVILETLSSLPLHMLCIQTVGEGFPLAAFLWCIWPLLVVSSFQCVPFVGAMVLFVTWCICVVQGHLEVGPLVAQCVSSLLWFLVDPVVHTSMILPVFVPLFPILVASECWLR